MSVRTSTARTRAARPARSARAARAGIAGLALTLLLTGCFDRGGEPTPEVSPTVTATATPSGTPADSTRPTAAATPTATSSGSSAEPESSPATTEAAGDLPSADLEITDTDGAPRRIEDVYHLECIHALDGEDVPEMTDAEVAEDTKPVWSVQRTQALTDGWKNCPTQMYGSIAIPSVFSIEASPGGGKIDHLRIFDADGRQVGGVDLDSTATAPEGTELLEVIGASSGDHLASPAYGDETPHLRTMVVRTASGHQLLIDLVSAPDGVDPDSLEAWDLAAGGGDRHLVYASIPLDSLADASEAADSELHAVLESMVGSYTVPVQ